MENLTNNVIPQKANDSEYDKNSLANKFMLMRGEFIDETDLKYIRTKRLDVDNLFMLIRRAFNHIALPMDVPVERTLDIGCGNGLVDRVLVDRKFTRFVVGIDKSRNMIELATYYCGNDTQHYKYIVKNASDLSDLGQFALIIQTYMLCEVENVDKLYEVFVSIRQACSGAFVGLIPSPFFDLKNVDKLAKYGIRYKIVDVVFNEFDNNLRMALNKVFEIEVSDDSEATTTGGEEDFGLQNKPTN
ncbi:unnamed protein product [Rotaria sp. Silwood2]|nr:unnamed protein product [Rotaria sp. Silwood2]CAF4183423.1 unnamed protein product [Rotaria sp. Silwood2]